MPSSPLLIIMMGRTFGVQIIKGDWSSDRRWVYHLLTHLKTSDWCPIPVFVSQAGAIFVSLLLSCVVAVLFLVIINCRRKHRLTVEFQGWSCFRSYQAYGWLVVQFLKKIFLHETDSKPLSMHTHTATNQLSKSRCGRVIIAKGIKCDLLLYPSCISVGVGTWAGELRVCVSSLLCSEKINK